MLTMGTWLLWPDGAAASRYDLLVVGALVIQAGMLAFKLESWEEAQVIFKRRYIPQLFPQRHLSSG